MKTRHRSLQRLEAVPEGSGVCNPPAPHCRKCHPTLPARAAGPIARRRIALVLIDAVALAGGCAVGYTFVQPSTDPVLAPALGAVALALFGAFALAGAHAIAGSSAQQPALLRALVLAPGALLMVAADLVLGLPQGVGEAALVLHAVAFSTALPAAWIYRRLIRDPAFGERTLLVGSGSLAERLAVGLEQHRPLGFCVAGHVSDDAEEPDASLGPRLGGVRDLPRVLREFEIDRVVLTDDRLDPEAQEALLEARLAGLPVDSGAVFFEWLHEGTLIDQPWNRLLVDTPSLAPGPLFAFTKRSIDIAAASIGLLVAAPVIAVTALAIKLDSPGPVFFSQMRLGRGGRAFRLWKLRSMCDDAERETGAVCAERDDVRVTRVGGFLRRSRIDELPQLWNVLRGDMSLVGPRPERPELAEDLARRFPLFRYRTAVRPGVTGWAQVCQGYVNESEGFGVKLSYDLFYLKNRSLRMDLVILWHTAGELLKLKGV